MTHKFGHINPWWDDSFKTLDYIYSPLSNTDDLERWIKEGYGGLNLNGAHYDMKRTMPDYAQPFFTLFDWDYVGITFFRMNTCEALPLHQDSYINYRARYNILDPSTVYRCIIFLEDWRSGHYFEIDGAPFVNWKRGDYVLWNNDVPHFAGNFGTEPRYTMQITGTQRNGT